MDRLVKLLIIASIFGVFLGVYFGSNDIEFKWWYAVILFFVVLSLLLISYLLKIKKAMKLCSKGLFDESIIEWEDMKNKYSKSPQLKNGMDLNIANCYFRKGDFDQALKILNKLNTNNLDKNSKALYYGELAGIYVLKGTNLDMAKEYLELSLKVREISSHYLFLALIELESGNIEKSNEMINNYHNSKENKNKLFGGTILIFDKEFKKMFDNYLLGIYYMKIKDLENAKKYFMASTEVSYENYYSISAQRLLNEF